MDYYLKLYNINLTLTFAVKHSVSITITAAYFFMQAVCVMVIEADSTPRRHYYLSNMSDTGEGNGRKRRRTVTEDEGMDTDEGNTSAILINRMLPDVNLINRISHLRKLNYFNLHYPHTTLNTSHSHHHRFSEAVLLGEEGDEEEVMDKREEIEEVVEVVEKVEKGNFVLIGNFTKVANSCTTRLANYNFITWRVAAVFSIDARITDSACNSLKLAANHFMNFINTKPSLPNIDNISLITGKGIKVDKEIEKIREEGDKSKGAGKNKRRICKRSDEAIKRRRVISEAKLKAKQQARKDGKSLPSGKPDDKCGGKALPPPIKGKGKAKNSKPLLRKTFRVDPRPTPRQDYVVAINIDGRPAIEEDRRVQMAALAFAMAVQQSSSTQPPIYLRDSRVENGTILLWCDSAASQESILSLLSNQDGITLTPRGGSRRLVFGVPGYMANLPGEMVLHLLERQNPELPQGSLQYVSLHNGPYPTIFVDADERAQEYLEDHDFRLETLTTDLRLRPAAEGKPPPK